MNESQLIAEELRKALDGDDVGDAWHGPSVRKILGDVTAAQANARPLAGGHSIWELVLHMTGWVREVERRLGGGSPGMPEEGDWPAPGEGEEAWRQALHDLAVAHASLIAAVESFPEKRWGETVGSLREPCLGTGTSYRAMVHGIVQHDAYHGGQIAILKKAFEA